MIIATLTVLILIIRFSCEEFIVKRQPWRAQYWNRFIRFFITGITVLVVAVPEGLPLAVTVSLAYAVKVSRRQDTYQHDSVRNRSIFLH
jgi:P-type Ca2+ transporter type 2B